MSLFDWVKYRTTKGAIKLHTLLDCDGNLPAYMHVTDGKTGDNKGAADIPLVKNSVIVADRYYFDSVMLNKWDSNDVYFVIRMKENIQFKSLKELELLDNGHEHILKDEIIEFKGKNPRENTLNVLEELLYMMKKMIRS